MVRYLKEGISQEEKDDADAQVRVIVEKILDDIKARGDNALKDYSEQFDKWRPDEFRLSRAEIDECYNQVTEQNIEDITFAQKQVQKNNGNHRFLDAGLILCLYSFAQKRVRKTTKVVGFWTLF